ncbi:MAG: DUF3037 domain-containing protein [Acidobacteria bacterium]|nr:DUF3037 domain-containing protein [Acidobacteriota bacterium]
MSVEHTYDYALIRVVPRVDRGECINAGVVLSCPGLDFLEACVALDPARIAVLDPSADLQAIQGHLDAIVRICRGGHDAGPVGELPQRARFHWLVSPRSTVIQMSPVHTGRTADPAASLARLVDTLVRVRP